MSFSRFAIGFSRHRKVSRLSDAAFRLWVSAIDYAGEQLTGGELETEDIDTLPKVLVGKKREEAIDELVAMGLWDEVQPDVWQIHDFDDWQDSPERVKLKRESARERMRRVRESRSLDVRANTGANTNEDGSREVRLTRSSSPISDSSPDHRSSSFQLSSEGSDRYSARGAKKPARSVHVPVEMRLDWMADPRQIAALAAKYAVPSARIEAQIPEFVWYWTQGKGAGKRKTERGWAAAFGNCVEAVAKRGALYAAPMLPAGSGAVDADPGQEAATRQRLAREAERERREIEAQTAEARAALLAKGIDPDAQKPLNLAALTARIG